MQGAAYGSVLNPKSAAPGSIAEGACMREIDGVGLNLECGF